MTILRSGDDNFERGQGAISREGHFLGPKKDISPTENAFKLRKLLLR